MLRFIHCSDLHIDSPFKGLSAINPELQSAMYQSTYNSFTNIVDLAISEKVNCLLVAGDIYDSANRSLRAQLKFRDELNRLSDAGIPSFIVHGNHDPLSSWSATLSWPANVHIFSGKKVEGIPLSKNGQLIAMVYGISYAKRDVTDNLSLKFKPTDEDVPHIGLLHCNVGNNDDHLPYAPASIEDLSSPSIDYWALGHIHRHNVLKDSTPAIVYSGSIQSRNARETGSKGCCLVMIDMDKKPDIQFIPTDSIRFETESVDISSCTSIDEIIAAVQTKCEKIWIDHKDRNVIIRINIIGKTSLHKELKKGDSLQELTEQIRDYFSNREPFIWIEQLILKTKGTYDLELIKKENSFVSDITSIYEELKDADSENWTDLNEVFNTLFTFWSGQKYLNEIPKDELIQLSEESMYSMLDNIIEVD